MSVDNLTAEVPDDVSGMRRQSIRRLIAANLDRFASLPREQVAWQVVCDVDSDDWRNVLLPLVLDEVKQQDRQRRRATEELIDLMPSVDEQFNPTPASAASTPNSDPPGLGGFPVQDPANQLWVSDPAWPGLARGTTGPRMAQGRKVEVANRDIGEWLRTMRDVLDIPFYLDDGTRCEWMTATADEHSVYVAGLNKQVAGVTKTINRHRKAIAHLEATGAASLAEIIGEVA